MIKRIVDIFASACGLLLLTPVMLAIAWLIRRETGSPVLFRQPRPGYQGRVFDMIKFRTMTSGKEADASRITPLGHFLRSTSLDELPELWNVLKGDMSLVGPRPLLVEYLPLYDTRQRRRHDVRPGITGWAQVNGRNLLSWDEKFELDVWYVENQSFGLDLRILLMTVLTIIRRDGIHAQGEATMPSFNGSRQKLVPSDSDKDRA
jgi:lipopolysaccharide/colanic/teichoic acid biosynthesis glycosyltransferase